MKMIKNIIGCIVLIVIAIGCTSNKESKDLSDAEKSEIKKIILNEINEGVEATRTKNIERYMSQMPEDLIIYDEGGKIISREKQKEYALRDWAIIDTTLQIMMQIDSIQYLQKDSILVYTYQEWERMMFQRDGITRDTILTNQRHKETWKKTAEGWFGYEVKELGGKVFINGKEYKPE